MKRSISRSQPWLVCATRGWRNEQLLWRNHISRCRASTAAGHSKSTDSVGRLLSTTRALLFAGFVGSIAYAVGINDAGNHSSSLLSQQPGPFVYAKSKELDLVSPEQGLCLTHVDATIGCRRIANCIRAGRHQHRRG